MRCYLITFIKIYVVYIFVYIYIYIRARIGICICVLVCTYVLRICTCTGGPDPHSLRYNMFFFFSRLRLRLCTTNYNLSESSPFRIETREFVHSSIRSNTQSSNPPPLNPLTVVVYTILYMCSREQKMPSDSDVGRLNCFGWTEF